MNELLLLIATDGTKREVFCEVRSIGQKEFYDSYATEFYPELKLVLADHLDYEGERLVEYEKQRYRVIRTYRAGQSIELTVERAPAEEGGIYG
jgi:hypothetical protein